MKNLKKRNMTRFDYIVRTFSIVAVIALIFSVVLLEPAINKNIQATHELTTEIARLDQVNVTLKNQIDDMVNQSVMKLENN